MRGVAWVVAASVLGASVLGGCARDPYVTNDGETVTGSWRIAHQIDRVTGAELPSAAVFAYASNTNVDFARVSSFQLTCFDKQPVVRFAFDFKIGSDRNSVLGYRFDDKPGHENVESRVLFGNQMIVIEDKAALAQFLGELAGASKLYMRVRSMTAGRSAAEYPLDGSAAALQAAFANCPLPSPQTPPPAAPPPARRTS